MLMIPNFTDLKYKSYQMGSKIGDVNFTDRNYVRIFIDPETSALTILHSKETEYKSWGDQFESAAMGLVIILTYNAAFRNLDKMLNGLAEIVTTLQREEVEFSPQPVDKQIEAVDFKWGDAFDANVEFAKEPRSVKAFSLEPHALGFIMWIIGQLVGARIHVFLEKIKVFNAEQIALIQKMAAGETDHSPAETN